MKRKKIRKLHTAIIITASLFAAVSSAYISGVFDFLENRSYDFRINFFAQSSRPSDDIILVIIDQNSIDWALEERSWVWPWPRSAYAEILDYMQIAGASSVMFDILFSEPSVYGREDDETFVKSAGEFGRSVHAVFFGTRTGRYFNWSEELYNIPLFQPEEFGELLYSYDLSQRFSQDMPVRGVFPIQDLRNASGGIGSVTGYPDRDDVFRRTRLFTLFDGKAVPSLSVAGLLADGKTDEIRFNSRRRVIEWGHYEIPVDRNGRTLLRFRGNIDRYIPYSAAEILQSAVAHRNGEEPLLPPEDFKNKYIFLGCYAPGLFDICNTPISSMYPGVGIHITFLDNLLQQDFIRESPHWIPILLNFVSIAMITFLVLYSSRIPIVIAGVFLIFGALCAFAMFAYYSSLNMWIPVVSSMVGIITAFVTTTLYNYATEGKQKKFIKSAFSQYLSHSVIEQLLANPERLSLGGERREISIFFSDVQGFTSISEKLDPAQLTELLNDYLSVMTDTILEYGGTIDKYEGDAIIAFWNAPLSYGDHAERALKASLECLSLMEEKQVFFQNKIGCQFLTRIGLNTGYAVVGNMGSAKRFDYTMIGDSVNLAARLESLNKQFGTYIMCTETTFKQADSVSGRKLALVAVVGKSEPVAVWEPMPEKVFHERKAILQRFDSARDMFYEGRFSDALPLFEELSKDDKPSFYYAKQCRHYISHPEDWKGFWQAHEK